MSVMFSTSLVPASDRLDAWEWNARQFCGDCRFHFPNRRKFHGSIQTKKLGDLELSLFSSTSVSFTKFPIRDSHPEHRFCTVITQLQGTRTYSQNGHAITLNRGDSTVIDSAFPWSSECQGNCVRLYLKTPRWLMENRLQTKVVPNARGISGSSTLGGALCHLANSLYREANSLTSEEAIALIEAYFDVLGGCLRNPHDNFGRPWNEPDLCVRMAKFIEKHLADPTLGPASIAAALGISTRHLHRLFAKHGRTAGEWIRECRLERCRSDLSDLRLRQRSVTEIAFSWGFCDSAHFSHAFKKRFGVSPRAFRDHPLTESWGEAVSAIKVRGLVADVPASKLN
ncbi:MAG TPA: helix-turn-helix domain-containing protein [Terriglobales bacterium]|nr:helix-turn-helix domain-containing protein [Terriglobales bacterium]